MCLVKLLCPKIWGNLNLELSYVRTNEDDLIEILMMFALAEKARQNYLNREKKMKKIKPLFQTKQEK